MKRLMLRLWVLLFEISKNFVLEQWRDNWFALKYCVTLQNSILTLVMSVSGSMHGYSFSGNIFCTKYGSMHGFSFSGNIPCTKYGSTHGYSFSWNIPFAKYGSTHGYSFSGNIWV